MWRRHDELDALHLPDADADRQYRVFPVTLAGCTPQSIACTPNLTPVQNGVFTPFGR
jgi:hypothetical protein